MANRLVNIAKKAIFCSAVTLPFASSVYLARSILEDKNKFENYFNSGLIISLGVATSASVAGLYLFAAGNLKYISREESEEKNEVLKS